MASPRWPVSPIGFERRLGPSTQLTVAQQQALGPAHGNLLDAVQLHTGAAAARAAAALQTRAFALGPHIGFAAGAFDPDSADGRRLLAHEMEHVAQSVGASATVLRGEWLDYPDIFGHGDAERALLDAVLLALEQGLVITDRSQFLGLAADIVGDVGDEWAAPEAANQLRAETRRLLCLAVTGSDGLPHDAFDLVAALTVLQRHAGVEELNASGTTLGVGLLLRTLAEDIAVQLTPPITPRWEHYVALAAVNQAAALHAGLETTEAPEESYRLELDATLIEVIETRELLVGLAPPEDAPLRQRLAQLSRRALLWQAALNDLRAGRGSPASTDLSQRMIAAGARVAEIRRLARTESETLEALGDDAERLTVQEVEADSALGVAPALAMLPEEALPATVDRATTRMLLHAAGVTRAAQAAADALRDELVPASPAYTLDEFAGVYRRWFAFFSPTRERSNPMFNMILGMFDAEAMADATLGREWRTRPEAERRRILSQATPYALTGVPSGLGSISGSAARGFMLQMFLPMLEGQLGSASAGDFPAVMPAASAAPLTATGSAAAPRLEVSAGFDLPAAHAGGERRLGATEASVHLAGGAAQRFSAVARTPSRGAHANAEDLARLLGARSARLRNPEAPLVGVRETVAAEGWSFLVEVEDPTTEEVVAREHRVMPLEVARYLMERRRTEALVRRPFVPRLAGSRRGPGRAVGDAPVRSRGLEATTATHEARLLGRPATVPANVDVAGRTLAADRSRKIPGGAELIAACETYIDGFFEQREGLEWRLGGLLVLANIEHGIERDVREAFDPARLAQVAAYAAAVTGGMAILDGLGPAGRIASAGVRGYLAAHNASPLAALTGIMVWLRMVGGVTRHTQARALALVSRPIVADLQNLVDEVATRASTAAVRTAMDRVRDRRPGTPSQLMRSLGDIARDPAAREPMLVAIDAELGRLRGATNADPAELQMYEAMRAEIVGAAARRPLPGRDAPLVGARPAGETRVPGLADWRPRSAAERAVLEAEIPADLRGRVRVVDDPLLSGSSTRVVPGSLEVRIHVGPRATADDVRAHVEVAREQIRFTGTVGRVRALVERVRTRLTGHVGHGTRGREAQQEVAKLERMLVDLESARDDLERSSADLTRPIDAEQRALLDQRIESIESQISLHARDMWSLEAGHGFVAAVDSTATVRDALRRGGLDSLEVNRVVLQAREAGQLDAMAQLVSVGVYARLHGAGLTPARVLEILRQPDGYARIVRADRRPEDPDSMRLLGNRVATAMRDERAAQARARMRAEAPASVSDRLRAEWGIDVDNRFSDAAFQRSLGMTVPEARAAARSANIATEPRILWRWRRYLEGFEGPYRRRVDNDSRFRNWAQRGYQANANREASSPFEAAAIEATGAAPNNLGLGAGGRISYEYREWVGERGGFVRSGADSARRPDDASDYYEATTRPDGIRPRADGGYDVVEHKHLTGTTTVLNDDIQLRGQREMAAREGHGRWVLVLSSDRGLEGGQPQVRVSRTLANAANADIFYFDGTRITHRYDATRDPPWQAHTETAPGASGH